MNSDDLSLFAQVARSGSISRVAMDLGTDPSTVSRHIRALETAYGVRLFHRSGRGVVLTERGQQLLVQAEQVMDAMAQAEQLMRACAQTGPARLCVAAQPTIARLLFGRLGHRLSQHYPQTRVRFVEGLASQILDSLGQGAVDLAVLYLPEHRGGIQFDSLLTEDIHLVVPADHFLRDASFDVRRLGEVPLILPSTPHGLRLLAESVAARHGVTLNVAFECDGSISITKRLVAQQCGCTILPAAAVMEDVAAGRLRSIPLLPSIAREVAIVWPKNRAQPTGLWQVTQWIRSCTADLVAEGAWPNTRLHAPVENV